MQKAILTISFFVACVTSYSQSTACDKFRTGIFQNIEDGMVRSIVERTNEFQHEEYGDKRIKLRIQWIDECSYRLIFIEGNEAWNKSRGENTPTPDLIVRITEIAGDSYLQEAKFVDHKDFQYKSSMVKVQ